MAQQHRKSVGIWIRVSTEDQARGESPEHHERRARLYAEAKDWNVRDVYHLEAVSGKAVIAHPEAQRMIADIKSGRITGLIFSKLARLARNTKELLEFADIFRDCDADLISLHESIDTTTPAGRLFYTMIAAMAQWEREEIAERVAASVPIRAKMGKQLGGQAPFGYRWEEGKLVPDPDEAPVRKLIYELFAKHQRKRTVARILNERGFRTRNGSEFSDTTVTRLIADPTAKGLRRANYTRTTDRAKQWELKPEADWVLHPVEAIVDVELWQSCNDIVTAQQSRRSRPSRKPIHLFTGLVYCHCDPDAKMYVPSNTPKYICYRCRNKIPTADLESVFHEQLRDFFFSDREVAKHLEEANEVLAGKERLLGVIRAEADKVAAEMEKVYQLYLADQIDQVGFGRRNDPLRKRQEEIEREAPALQAEIDIMKVSLLSSTEIIQEARDLYSKWPELPLEEKRYIVETITDRITVGEGDVEIELLYVPPSREDGGNATRPQGFIAATSWNRAGKVTCALARATTASPVSSGWRRLSSTWRGNSGSSSRKRTPRCASETSPGFTRRPPPTRAGIEAE